MTFRLSKNFHGVGIGPLSKILAVKTKQLFARNLDQTPQEPNHFDHKFLLILYAIPEISILNDKSTGLYLVHSTIGCSYSSDPSNFVQLPHSFRKPRQKHVFSNFFFTKRYLLLGSYYTYWSYYTYCLIFFLIESIENTGRFQ